MNMHMYNQKENVIVSLLEMDYESLSEENQELEDTLFYTIVDYQLNESNKGLLITGEIDIQDKYLDEVFQDYIEKNTSYNVDDFIDIDEIEEGTELDKKIKKILFL